MTLIGPNGSGKSTILKSIVRQLRLLGGVVRLEQVSLEELSPQAVARKMSRPNDRPPSARGHDLPGGRGGGTVSLHRKTGAADPAGLGESR